ncbi:MAG: hypothetical protein IPL92_11745 [Saprospiraceae bacterium]|nr:hypothetical protein [Candidatus Opimibacter iunctus]
MTAIAENNIYGFFASLYCDETEQEMVKSFLWSENGLKEKLKPLKWYNYGEDFHLILFQFYVNPPVSLHGTLREIENYRRKEKSIGVPIVLDKANFFNLNEDGKYACMQAIILDRLIRINCFQKMSTHKNAST